MKLVCVNEEARQRFFDQFSVMVNEKINQSYRIDIQFCSLLKKGASSVGLPDSYIVKVGRIHHPVALCFEMYVMKQIGSLSKTYNASILFDKQEVNVRDRPVMISCVSKYGELALNLDSLRKIQAFFRSKKFEGMSASELPEPMLLKDRKLDLMLRLVFWFDINRSRFENKDMITALKSQYNLDEYLAMAETGIPFVKRLIQKNALSGELINVLSCWKEPVENNNVFYKEQFQFVSRMKNVLQQLLNEK